MYRSCGIQAKKKTNITFILIHFGDLCSDFGANVKFLVGSVKKFKKINIGNLKTNISNKKVNQNVNGNTNTVYINPLNSLRFVLNKVKKDKINLSKDFLYNNFYRLFSWSSSNKRQRSLHW